MSTYYYFGCKNCKKKSDTAFIRNPGSWGWNDKKTKEVSLFIIDHTRECEEDSIFVFSEHHEAFDWEEAETF